MSKGTDYWDWRDHIPSGGMGMDGYGYVICSCGWVSDFDKLGWVEHIEAMMPPDPLTDTQIHIESP